MYEQQHVSRLGREMRRRTAAGERAKRERELRRAIGGFAQVPFIGENVVSSADPTLFDPNTVPGILWWFNSENITTTTVGPDVFVDSMLDLSTISGSALAESAGQRPIVNFGNPQFNGAATLTWSNAAATCMRAPVVNIGPFTLVMVARVTSALTYLWAFNDVYLYGSTGYTFYQGVRDGTGAAARDASLLWPNVGAPITVSVRSDGTNAGLKVRVNGADPGWTPALTDDPGTLHINTYITLLCYIDGTTAASDAEFGTALLWDNSISDANLDSVEAKFRGYYQHY